MSAVPLATGPAMFFGSSIMSFALPYGAFIVSALVLFYLYRRPHYGPRLKYLASGPITSVLTREPGPIPAPSASGSADAESDDAESAGAEPGAPAVEPASAQAPAEEPQTPAEDKPAEDTSGKDTSGKGTSEGAE